MCWSVYGVSNMLGMLGSGMVKKIAVSNVCGYLTSVLYTITSYEGVY